MNRRWNREKIMFVIYSLVMLWLLYGQRMVRDAYTDTNFVPFKTINNYITVLLRTSDPAMLRHIVINLFGNIAMFVPLGYFLPAIWRKFRSFICHVSASVLIIVMIEQLQYVSRLGSMDIDDLLLNILGTTLGYMLWRMIESIRA